MLVDFGQIMLCL